MHEEPRDTSEPTETPHKKPRASNGAAAQPKAKRSRRNFARDLDELAARVHAAVKLLKRATAMQGVVAAKDDLISVALETLTGE